METKRVTIPASLYNELLNELPSSVRARFDKKGDAVASSIQNVFQEYKNVQNGVYTVLDDDTRSRVELLNKMGISSNSDEVIKESVKFYVDSKKEEIKKLIDSL